jgi:hypothetical protein
VCIQYCGAQAFFEDVIASAAKQSPALKKEDCFVVALLAMTGVATRYGYLHVYHEEFFLRAEFPDT